MGRVALQGGRKAARPVLLHALAYHFARIPAAAKGSDVDPAASPTASSWTVTAITAHASTSVLVSLCCAVLFSANASLPMPPTANSDNCVDLSLIRKDLRKDNSLIGAAGVHYAAYKLSQRGMLALPTVRNTPGTDLIVTSLDGRHHANIQVKTTQSKGAKFWPVCSIKRFAKLAFGEHDFYVLLRPRRADDPPGAEEMIGFMLTAEEAKTELSAHLASRRREVEKFPLCIWTDKGVPQQTWDLPQDSKEAWRKRWQEWRI